MLYPLVPIFLTTVLGVSGFVVGLVEGIAEATARIIQVFSGYLSDKYKNRRTLTISGYSLSTLGKPLLALSVVWPMALFARFIDRFGKGFRTPPRDALIVESSQPKQRGRAFGFHRSMDSVGAVLGPLVSLVLVAFLAGKLRIVFALATIPAAIAVGLLFMVREKPVAEIKEEEAKTFVDIGKFKFGKRYYTFLFVSLVFALGNSSDAFLLLRAKQLGLTATQIVLVYVVYNAIYALTSLPAGVISDRLGRKRILVYGFIVYSLVYLGFGLTDNKNDIWLLYAVYGVYIGMTEGISKALIGDIVTGKALGSAFGLFQTATGMVLFLASFIAGILWTYVSFSVPFYFGSAMALIAAVLFMFVFPEQPR